MASYIPDDFKPNDATIDALRREGIFQDFLEHILPHFREYWGELKTEGKKAGKKAAWQTTFRTWARRAFRGRVGREFEENKHKRHDRGGLKNDLFEQVADSLKKPAENFNPPKKIKKDLTPKQCPSCGGFGGRGHKCPYIDTPAMKPEDAFKQLSEILK